MTSPTLKTDVIIAIRQPHLDHIASLKKNHEFRNYLIPATVKRFWIYEPRPVSAIKYVAEVSKGKGPEQMPQGDFIGNAQFIEGKMANSRFGYEIIRLEEITKPITLIEMQSKGWLGGAPQKYCYLKESMARAVKDIETVHITSHSIGILDDLLVERIEDLGLAEGQSKQLIYSSNIN
jgi:hypothetical protein